MSEVSKIGLGGGCHWCTEAVFKSLKGVVQVVPGFVASNYDNSDFSEAIIVHFHMDKISIKDLISVHLNTHESTSNHSMRGKYRSAIYTFNTTQAEQASRILIELQADFSEKLITRIYPFMLFEPSDKRFHDYYYANPEKPFCKKHISPKLKILLDRFSHKVDPNKLSS
ncbi:MAG: peptide-methionine (S)-S-oxide reductase [Maribacter sp.]